MFWCLHVCVCVKPKRLLFYCVYLCIFCLVFFSACFLLYFVLFLFYCFRKLYAKSARNKMKWGSELIYPKFVLFSLVAMAATATTMTTATEATTTMIKLNAGCFYSREHQIFRFPCFFFLFWRWCPCIAFP